MGLSLACHCGGAINCESTKIHVINFCLAGERSELVRPDSDGLSNLLGEAAELFDQGEQNGTSTTLST